jgi:MHS family proline/betaine transporter-like MFS transporter
MVKMTKNKINILTLLLGNSLEFYDIIIYSLFHHNFTEYYFKDLSYQYAAYLSWMAFAVAYLARPLGATFFGYVGDKISRRTALRFSIFGMAISTFLIGILPTYQIIGIWAPIILMLLRFIQGFSMAGECNGVALYLLENTIFANQPRISAMVIASTFLGSLLGCVVALLASLSVAVPLWRLCFIFGSLVAFIGFYVRNNNIRAYKQNYNNQNLIFKEIWKNKVKFFIILFITGLNGSMGYILLGFLGAYLREKKLFCQNTITLVLAIGILSAVISALLACLKEHSKKNQTVEKLIIQSSIKALLICFLSMKFLESNSLSVLVWASILLGYSVGLVGRYLHFYISFLMPKACRYTGTSLAFSLGMAFFGGTAPVVYTFLLDSGYNIALMPIYPTIIFLILILLNIIDVRDKREFKIGAD